MGNLSKLLLDQSAQFPSEPLLAPECLTNFFNMHFTEKKNLLWPFFVTYCFYLFILNMYPRSISLFNAQILLSLRLEEREGGGYFFF